jgi:biotin carboxylase
MVIASQTGFVSRSDAVERRYEGCDMVEEVVTLVTHAQRIDSVPSNDLRELLNSAVAGLLLRSHMSTSSWENMCTRVAHEFENRLGFSLLQSGPCPSRRLIWVEGRKDIEACRRIYEAASALGIKLVVIDNPGHWLQDENGPHAYLREAFIPMNIAVDEGFVQRLTETVQAFTEHTVVDGIITISDARLFGVAKVCEALGYATSPSSAYNLAGDKYKTRSLESDCSESFLITSMEEMEDMMAKEKLDISALKYPLIVKPCFGWASECVAKVSNVNELLAAAAKASARHANSSQKRSDFMIEPYVDGPEVDANFVLLDGQVVFYEVADDFPSLGDACDSTAEANFQETANLLPTGLPPREVEIVRDSILNSLLRMGFSSGTFHCEGRIKDSSMQYARRADVESSWDLIISPDRADTPEPSFFLHEINARPAGYLESVATALTYGIDYYALQLLFSAGDTERYRSLAQPFKNGPQWHLALLLIPEDRRGTMKTPDSTIDLMQHHPDIAAAIVDHKTVIKGGDRCLGPTASELNYLAYISVVSRSSRDACLKLSETVRREFRYELLEDEQDERLQEAQN